MSPKKNKRILLIVFNKRIWGEREILHFKSFPSSLIKNLSSLHSLHLEIEINKDLETLIKIEICEIFEYLLDWREDFFI